MPIANAKQRKIGRELVEWIYLGIRTGARSGVAAYRQNGDLNQLKRAVDLPNRARVRLETWITRYDAANGAGAAAQFLTNALALFGAGVTIGNINNELSTLENYAANLVAQAPLPYGDGSLTWDDIASNIESNVENESDDWVFRLPVGYTDVWGE